MPDITIDEARALVTTHWADTSQLRPTSIEKFDLLMRRFGRFAAAHEISLLADVGVEIVDSFVRARGRDRRGAVSDAAASTMQVRRAVLRAFYRTARDLHLTWDDPARDIALPARPGSATRPLREDETELLWMHAWSEGRLRRHAATVALMLSGVHSGEVGHIGLGDVDVEARTVYAHGSVKFLPRVLDVEPRYMDALAARGDALLARLPGVAPECVVLATKSEGSDGQKQARVCTTIKEALRRAGLADDPQVRPTSLTAVPARAVFDASGRIDLAAGLLGLSSLDTAARAIAWDWRGES
ncbi:site-specific integrase [Cellulomonas cellasea]|uniref:Integrase/recombinase XerC n=1 Tax=Cellulomonas cellasea TaxID=43670 RepID=A0A7W4UH60_9CELL|nr:site-specific integrase [Cellulomonas cellasea]MBB2924091.1 integrase/recombinase XerC [Cellulomonas cellasea]